MEAVSGKAEARAGRVGCVSSLLGSVVVWSGGSGVGEGRYLIKIGGEIAEVASWECSTAAGLSGRVASRAIGMGTVAGGRRAGLWGVFGGWAGSVGGVTGLAVYRWARLAGGLLGSVAARAEAQAGVRRSCRSKVAALGGVVGGDGELYSGWKGLA